MEGPQFLYIYVPQAVGFDLKVSQAFIIDFLAFFFSLFFFFEEFLNKSLTEKIVSICYAGHTL